MAFATVARWAGVVAGQVGVCGIHPSQIADGSPGRATASAPRSGVTSGAPWCRVCNCPAAVGSRRCCLGQTGSVPGVASASNQPYFLARPSRRGVGGGAGIRPRASAYIPLFIRLWFSQLFSMLADGGRRIKAAVIESWSVGNQSPPPLLMKPCEHTTARQGRHNEDGRAYLRRLLC